MVTPDEERPGDQHATRQGRPEEHSHEGGRGRRRVDLLHGRDRARSGQPVESPHDKGRKRKENPGHHPATKGGKKRHYDEKIQTSPFSVLYTM